ncbi:MAG: DUF5115 domain-containing protein [Prevotella sp.]|nr:DUF5115 domain-containing protein [Prevotella sp.]
MKKLGIFMTALLSMGFVACTENFDATVGPQSYTAESPLAASDVSVSTAGAPTAINLEDYINENEGTGNPITFGTVSVIEGAMPVNTILKAEVEIAREADFGNSVVLAANTIAEDGLITIDAGNLQTAYFEGITKNPATVTLYSRIILYTVTGGEAEAIIGKPGENYFAVNSITFTPLNKLTIAPAYYIVGGPNDWQASAIERTIKFQHSDEDVYVDPIFTVTFDAADGDTWFAIGDDQACDAIAAGDWSQLYGIVGGDNEATEGKIARRSELGGDNSFCVKGAKKIRVTIDMMEQTFTVEAVNIAESYYLVGGNGSWSSDKSQKFSHSDKDVFEDPVFSYVLTGGSELWFAFGDAEALDAIDANDWSQLFGTTGASEDLSGSFDRRYNLDGDHSFHVDGSAKFYRFTINALDMTYEITPLNFDPYIYFIGATDGWTNAEQKLALTDESGIYTGFLYCADPNGWGNEFKFQKVPGDWGTEINTGHMTGGITGDFGDGGGNFKATAGEGVYYVTLDMATMSINAVRIQNMNLVGDFNGWNAADDAQQMTWNATDYCFEISGAGVTANGWKFTTNNSWSINLGGDVADLVANGDNLTVVGTTIKLYPTRKDKDNIYCTIE